MSSRVCKFYARGTCFKGDQCDFIHERQDRPADICSYFQKGFCSYGSHCKFRHVKTFQASSSANGGKSLVSDRHIMTSQAPSSANGGKSLVPDRHIITSQAPSSANGGKSLVSDRHIRASQPPSSANGDKSLVSDRHIRASQAPSSANGGKSHFSDRHIKASQAPSSANGDTLVSDRHIKASQALSSANGGKSLVSDRHMKASQAPSSANGCKSLVSDRHIKASQALSSANGCKSLVSDRHIKASPAPSSANGGKSLVSDRQIKASQAPSSANGGKSLVSDSVVGHSAKGTSSRFGKGKLPSPDKPAWSSQHKYQDSLGIGNVAESSASSAIPSEQLFCSFAAANCPLGNKCSRIHGNQCLYCRKYCLHPTDPEEKENHLRTCDKKENYLQALKDSEEIECNVCLERVLSKAKPSECKFGVLPECDHAFCLSCIRNWRNSGPTSAMDINNSTNRVKTCPVCRKLSYFVIPSGIWFSTKEEKQEIIDNYKANCRLIDCKHFNSGNGNCPFGKACFYKHTVKPGSYTWIHQRPPPKPRRRPNHFDMHGVIDMLSEVDLSSAEFYSIMRDSEIFEALDPYEMMALSDNLASGSGGPYMGHFDSDDEDFNFFQMAALSEALVADEDDFGSEDFGNVDFNPVEAALISMMMHSNMEEEAYDDDDDDDEEYSDEDY